MSTELLVQSLASHADTAELAPGKFGAILPAAIPVSVLESFAKVIQESLVNYAGPVAEKFIDAEHDVIAAWVSPKMADFVGELVAKFGDAAK